MAIPGWAHYRESTSVKVNCGTCLYFFNGECTMFDTQVDAGMVCDEWEGEEIQKDGPQYTANAPSSRWDQDDVNLMSGLVNQLEPAQKGAGTMYLISHAKTRFNRPGQPHDIVHGWKQTPLDSTGKKQAKRLGAFLKNKGITEVHSSDLNRAQQTAEVISRTAGAPMKASRNYRPWNLGDFAGHSSADVIPKLKPYMAEKSDQPIDGGESFDAFKNRFIPAVEKLMKQTQQGKTLALVTHSRNIELMQGWLGGKGHRTNVDTNAISEDKLDPASVFEVSPGRGGKMTMTQLTDETIQKGTAQPAELNLRVHGVSRHPAGDLMYRMETRDGHYVGRTLPTKVRAKKGDILKVQANDFMQDTLGNITWQNPNVVAHYDGAAHSYRELNALAGGMLKEAAPGPAGDMPAMGDDPMPLGDTGMDANVPMGTGPTLQDVHVNRPLKNISVGYQRGRPKKLQVVKADKRNQLIYGVVLEPNTIDSQDDFMLPDQVEKAAHGYLKKVARGQAAVSKLQHVTRGFHKSKPSVVPVESFIAPCDFSYDGKETVKKGTWVMVLHAEDPTVWQDVLNGKYTGLSIGGTGIRQDVSVPQELVPGQWMESEPTWTQKEAKPQDFSSWRDYGWEGSFSADKASR